MFATQIGLDAELTRSGLTGHQLNDGNENNLLVWIRHVKEW